MRYLFIVQGEGRGHMTQAMTLEGLLRKRGHEVVRILVGRSQLREIPDFFLKNIHAPVTVYDSVNFMPSVDNRKPDMVKSILMNVMGFGKYLPSLRKIYESIVSSKADVVVNFYELLSGLTYLFYRIDVPMVCIGHQYLLLHKDFGLPRRKYPDSVGLNMLTRLTSLRASKRIALSFREMTPDRRQGIVVVPPLLRPEVLAISPVKGDYIHGYMLNHGFAKDVKQWHDGHPETPLHFFWDNKDAEKVTRVDNTLTFHTLSQEEFLNYMKGCYAYASTAGFESICEAMWMNKPVLMVPSHIEQEINAFDAQRSGIGIASDRFDLSLLLGFAGSYNPDPHFRAWALSAPELIVRELENL